MTITLVNCQTTIVNCSNKFGCYLNESILSLIAYLNGQVIFLEIISSSKMILDFIFYFVFVSTNDF